MQKMTTDEHFIPQFFIKHFYAKTTDISINAVEGKICCLRFDKEKPFNCLSDKICFEKYLYETAFINEKVYSILVKNKKELEAVENYFENKFRDIEGFAQKKFEKIFLLCDKSQHGYKVLSNRQIEFLTNYMALQFFRLPSLLIDGVLSYYNIICENNNTKYRIDADAVVLMLHNVLNILLQEKSSAIESFAKAILKSHTVSMIKSNNDFSFFTSDMPVFLFGDLEEGDNVFEKCEIFFPLSPKYCLCFSNKNNGKHKLYHKKILQATEEISDFYINVFINFVLPNATFIFSDSISNETIIKLREAKL